MPAKPVFLAFWAVNVYYIYVIVIFYFELFSAIDHFWKFLEKGAVVLGVSKDSVESHKRFEEKQNLAFTILSDPERKVIEAYDVWKEKKNYGKVSMGVVRTTYLIDENGIIIKANDKVKAAEDPENMLKQL